MVLGDITPLAGFSGLKLRTAVTILLAIMGRLRTRVVRQFRVALTSTASLVTKVRQRWDYCLDTIPIIFVEDVQETIEQARRFSFEFRYRNQRVISRDENKGNLALVRSLSQVLVYLSLYTQ